MVIYRFPPDSGQSGDQSEVKPGKSPDFIYIDDISPGLGDQEERVKRESPFSGLTQASSGYPFFLRILTLVIAFFLTCFVTVLFCIFLVVSAFAVIFLFQSQETTEKAKKLWKSVGRFSAYALALYVATISPAFGFGILTLYAMQGGADAQPPLFFRLFKGRF